MVFVSQSWYEIQLGLHLQKQGTESLQFPVVLNPDDKAFLETVPLCLCKQTETCLLLYMIICLSIHTFHLLCWFIYVWICLFCLYILSNLSLLPTIHYLASSFSFLSSVINHLLTYYLSTSFWSLCIFTYLSIIICPSFISFNMKLSRTSWNCC